MTSKPPTASSTLIIGGVVVITCFVVAAATAIFIAVPEGANTGSIVTLLLGSAASSIATLVTLVKVTEVSRRVEDLGNGVMDAKIRTGVARVLDSAMVDESAREQLVADQVVVDQFAHGQHSR